MCYYGNVMTTTRWRICYYGNVMTTTRWRISVTNRLRCILHLQQYSHRLNLLFFWKSRGRVIRGEYVNCYILLHNVGSGGMLMTDGRLWCCVCVCVGWRRAKLLVNIRRALLVEGVWRFGSVKKGCKTDRGLLQRVRALADSVVG